MGRQLRKQLRQEVGPIWQLQITVHLSLPMSIRFPNNMHGKGTTLATNQDLVPPLSTPQVSSKDDHHAAVPDDSVVDNEDNELQILEEKKRRR